MTTRGPIFRGYKYYKKAVDLRISEYSSPEALTSAVNKNGVLDLQNSTDFQTCKTALEIEISEDAGDLVQDGEKLRLLILARNPLTKTRERVVQKTVEPGESIKFDFEFERGDYWGSIQLEPSLVVRAGREDGDRNRRKVGSGGSVEIVLDRNGITGNRLPCRYADFSEEENLDDDQVFALRHVRDAEPYLLINSDTEEEVISILNSEDEASHTAKIRDLMYGSMFSPAVIRMILVALQSADIGSEIETEYRWEKRTLEDFSEKTGLTEEQLKTFSEIVGDNDLNELLEFLEVYTQKAKPVKKQFEKATNLR